MESNNYKFSDSASNCHRHKDLSKNYTENDTGADRDSAKSKEVVKKDDREKRNGPGGN